MKKRQEKIILLFSPCSSSEDGQWFHGEGMEPKALLTCVDNTRGCGPGLRNVKPVYQLIRICFILNLMK